MKNDHDLVSVLVCNRLQSCKIKTKVKAYQISGPLFETLNDQLKRIKLSARGAWVLEPVEAWNQSASPEAGNRIV